MLNESECNELKDRRYGQKEEDVKCVEVKCDDVRYLGHGNIYLHLGPFALYMSLE